MTTRRIFLAGAGALAALSGMPMAAALGKNMSQDIAILRSAFETMHPGLYRYATLAQIDRGFRQLEARWAGAASLAEAYLSLSEFLATIRCGHTYANFYNQKQDVVQALFAARNKLPFRFRWLDRRMIITSEGGSALVPGTEVLAIDGRPVQDVLQRMLAIARADGSNDAKRVELLEVKGDEGFQTFDVFFALIFPIMRNVFDIQARAPGSKALLRLSVDAIDLNQRRAQSKSAEQAANAPLWSLAFDRKDVARLTMPTWAVYNSKWDWKGFLNDAFQQIRTRNSRSLIVDLRGNEGGLDCGDEIIARLIDEALPRVTYERRVRYRQAPKELDPYLDTWDPSFKDWGADAVPLDDRYFRLIESDGQSRAPILPQGPRFNGKVVVLVDAANSSATFQFSQLVQSRRLGTLLGAPTGGNLRGINGGAFFFLRLPNSGLEVDLPLIATFPSTPQPDAGLTPDVLVSDTASDIAQGRDVVLAKAIEVCAA